MTGNLKIVLAASAIALAVVSSGVQAADIASESGCYLAGDGRLGGMYNAQTLSAGGQSFDVDWGTLIGEGRGLVSCDNLNFQGDFAYYGHETKTDFDGKNTLDFSTNNSHFGGAMFWRDQNVGLIGLTGSRVTQDMLFKDTTYLRAGLMGEYFVNDQFTIGAGAHYIHTSDFSGKDSKHSGFELAANLKYYVNPDFSLKLEGAYLDSKFSGLDGLKLDGFSAGIEAEYLIWDQGMSVFGGGRYSEREFSQNGGDFKIEDLQAYIGLKIAFGGNTQSLVTRDRSGPIDNTSIFLEKLPNPVNSFFAAVSEAGVD